MSSSASNSWTILAPEESAAAETLRPRAEETERQDEPSAPAAGDGAKSAAEEDHLTAEETLAKPCQEVDPGVCLPPSAPLEVSYPPVPDARDEDTPVDAGQSSAELESFSDSYSHLGPSTEDGSTSAPATETLGHLDSGQGEEEEEGGGQADVQGETQHQSETQELQEEEPKETADLTQSPLPTPPEPPVQTESITAQEAEPEVRRRRSLLERIGRHDEEEEAEEDFQLPQREEDSGITLNKCILGAVILLGLGTIFISGVFTDLDQESEHPTVELKDSEAPGGQEWLNPASEADATELLNKLNKENKQITMLQSQLESQNEELKVAQAQAAEGSADRLRHEEVEKENSRLKRDVESVPVLQKELEKMRTELESVSGLKKEVESLRSTLTQLKLSAAATAPSGGRTEYYTQAPADQHEQRKDKHDRGVREEWKEKSEWKKEKKQRKDGGRAEGKEKERKKERFEDRKSDRKRKEDRHPRQNEASGDWRKDKSKRGDEGKPWKNKDQKKDSTERKDKKSKQDKFKEDKEWRGREEWRDVKESKYHGEKHKGHGDKERKKGRDGHKEEYKEKFERKHWKESEGLESRSRKDTGERRERSDDAKDQKKWKKKSDGERQGSKAGERDGDEKEGHKGISESHKGHDHREHMWSERKPTHSHPKPAMGQPEYWSRQRERLQHSPKPLQPCHTPETCAQAQGVRPVDHAEFEAVLQNYLSKAQLAGVDASLTDELKKMVSAMFQNGVFPHDRMSFEDFVEDVADILEDLVEGEDDGDGDEPDETVEDEMEGFEREVMQKFATAASDERGGAKGEGTQESGRGRA